VNINAVLIAYCSVVLLSRFLNGETSTATWEVVITVAIGVVLALQPVRRPGQKEKLTPAALLLFPLLVAMALAARKLFVLLPSVAFVAYGLRGLANGRITLGGRVGPGREYTGAMAYFHSAWCILSGAALIAVDFIFPGFWER
jgi:hypothetical protein